MGSKMSFGRRSSDQNTISDLTSVTSSCVSIHAPSDFRQIPEGMTGSEGDPEPTSGESMKATELTETTPQLLSPGHLESSGSANVGKADVTKQLSKFPSPQVEMEAQHQTAPVSVCSSKTGSHGSVEVRRKPGRPRKIKPLLTEDKTDPKTTGLTAVQHRVISTTVPTCCTSDTVVCPLINNSDTYNASNNTSEGGVPVLLKRKRGRPRKADRAALNNQLVKTAAVSAPSASANVGGPAWTLRSRKEQHLLAEAGKTESKRKESSKQTKRTPLESSTPPNTPAVKRGRPKLTNQQVPAKVSRLRDSHGTSSVLGNDTDCEERAVADKQVEVKMDKQEVKTDGKGGLSSQKSRAGQEQTRAFRKVLLPQRRLRSHTVAEPEVVPPQIVATVKEIIPSQSDVPKITPSVDTHGGEELQTKSSFDSLKHVDIPQNSEPMITDAVITENLEPAEIPPAVKTENLEVELDNLSCVSEVTSPKSVHNSVSATVKPEGLNTEQTFLRLKKGGKRRRRRRRRSNVLLQREGFVEDQAGSADIQSKTGCLDTEGSSNVDSNVIYTKKGAKTLFKCGYCSRTFKFLSQFIIHQRVHTGERPFKCPHCDKGFSKNSNLNLHLKTHRKSNIYQKCPFCKIKFSCSEYPSHMKMHEQELLQVYESDTSEKQSNATGQENSHGPRTPVSPEKRKRKVCQYCGKTFPFQSALLRHVRVHTGEKPYRCDICGKAFGQAYFLRVHELTHWSVKRYNCTRCEKSFTHYSNAKNHTCKPAGREGEPQPSRRVRPLLTYTCHICKNVFDHLQEFNSHMRNHTGAKLYRCLHCDKLFGVLSEFHTHRGKCRGEKSLSSSVMKAEGTMSLIQYTVPVLRGSPAHDLMFPPTSTNGETEKRPSQNTRRKRLANLKKPFQSTVDQDHHVSHLVLKLNELDNRSDPRKYLCPSCGRLFRHMGRLRAHMLTHTPGQSYTCTCCGKTLENWRKLWQHQRIHRQRRGRFICPKCGRGFRFVEPYKKHMSEHPEFHWVHVRPRKIPLPYECELCRCSFRTLDLLFNHQLCHSSTQDMHKDSDFDLSIDAYSTQSKKVLNQSVATLHQEAENSSPLSPSPKYQDPLPQLWPLTPMITFNHNQDAGLGKSLLHPGGTCLSQDTEPSYDGSDKTNGKPVMHLRSLKSPMTPKNSKSNTRLDGVKCAVCGNAYFTISDLYHHYLQHARGQV